MSKTIMVVDDAASLRQVATIALESAGYDVITACDGQDALSKLGGRKIHLIVSDLHMPRMDGIAFVKAMKQDPAYRFTPVLMLTTESGEDKKQLGKEAGVKAWLVKPFQPQTLLDAVAKLILP